MKQLIHKILLSEGRLEDIKSRYPENKHGLIDRISENDPSGNNKYLEWMVKTVIDGDGDIYDSDFISDINFFHENQQSFTKKDLNQYKSWEELRNAVEVVFDKKQEKAARKDRDKIYEDDKWIVIVPKSHQASCHYGKHSNWCVSTSNDSYYEQYSDSGMLAFVLWKQKREEEPNEYKIAVHIPWGEIRESGNWDWYDKKDDRIDGSLLYNFLPSEMINTIKNHAIKVGTAKGKIKDEKWRENLIKSIEESDSVVWYMVDDDGITFSVKNNDTLRWLEDKNIEDDNDYIGSPFETIEENTYYQWLTINNEGYLDYEYKTLIGVIKKALSRGLTFFESIYDGNQSYWNLDKIKWKKGGKEYTEKLIRDTIKSEPIWVETESSEIQVGDTVKVKPKFVSGGRVRRRAKAVPAKIVRKTPSGYLVTEPLEGYPNGKRFKSPAKKLVDTSALKIV